MNVIASYLKARSTQKSTWLGISAIITALAMSGGTVTPDVAISVLTAVGLIDVDA